MESTPLFDSGSRLDTRARYAQRLQAVHDWLATRLDQPADLHDLAGLAHLSPYHFHRVYRGLMGETVADTLRRLRLHRAAVQLLSSDWPVERIARAAQYGSAAAFTRAFGEAYGQPPAAFRAERSRGASMPAAAPSMLPAPHQQEPAMYEVEFVTLQPLRVAALPHRGAYHQIGTAFERLTAWAAGQGLLGPATRSFGLYYDDPHAVSEADLRSDACVALPEGRTLAAGAIPDGLHEICLPSGPCARIVHVGPYADLERAYDWLYGEWLPTSGRTPGHAPCCEEYLNDCRTLPPTEWRTAIYLPLVPA